MEFLSANAFGQVRRVVENGREYLVAPASMLNPGVLPGSKGPLLYTAEDTRAVTPQWDRIPITNDHPYDALSGAHLSANDDGVLERQGIGEVRTPTFPNKLRSELWFDVQRTRAVNPEIYNKLVRGEPIELSTGLYTDNEPAPPGSQHNGRPYTHIARNHRPDHLAILTHATGACSIKDGCGVLVNREQLTANAARALDAVANAAEGERLQYAGFAEPNPNAKHTDRLEQLEEDLGMDLDHDDEAGESAAHRAKVLGNANPEGHNQYTAAKGVAAEAEKVSGAAATKAFKSGKAEDWHEVERTSKAAGDAHAAAGEAAKKVGLHITAAQHKLKAADLRQSAGHAAYSAGMTKNASAQTAAVSGLHHTSGHEELDEDLPELEDETPLDRRGQGQGRGKQTPLDPPPASPSRTPAANANPRGINQYSGGYEPAGPGEAHKVSAQARQQARDAGVRLGKASKEAFKVSDNAVSPEEHSAAAEAHEAVAAKTGNEYLHSMHKTVAAAHKKYASGTANTSFLGGLSSLGDLLTNAELGDAAWFPSNLDRQAAFLLMAGWGLVANDDPDGLLVTNEFDSDEQRDGFFGMLRGAGKFDGGKAKDDAAGAESKAAADASAEASKRSGIAKKVNKNRQAKEHGKAADAHDKAAEAHDAAGNKDMAEKHRGFAAEHRAKAKSLTGNANPEGHNQYTKGGAAIHTTTTKSGAVDNRPETITGYDKNGEQLSHAERMVGGTSASSGPFPTRKSSYTIWHKGGRLQVASVKEVHDHMDSVGAAKVLHRNTKDYATNNCGMGGPSMADEDSGGTQSGDAHAATKQAAAASLHLEHGKAFDHAKDALDCSKDDDCDGAAAAHDKAAKAHDGAAKRALQDGNVNEADSHLEAAKMHRKAGILHKTEPTDNQATVAARLQQLDQLITANCGGKGGTKGPCKGGGVSKGATAASAKANASGSAEDHMEAATTHDNAAKFHTEQAAKSTNAAAKAAHEKMAAEHSYHATNHEQQAGGAEGKGAVSGHGGMRLSDEGHLAISGREAPVQRGGTQTPAKKSFPPKTKPGKAPRQLRGGTQNQETTIMNRSQAVALLTANCKCQEDRAALNRLSDDTVMTMAAAQHVANRKRLAANAGKEGDDEEEEGGGEGEDSSMEENAAGDLHSFDVDSVASGGKKGGSLQAGGKGTKDEYPANNRQRGPSMKDWLRTAPIEAQQMYHEFTANKRQERTGLILQLVNNRGLQQPDQRRQYAELLSRKYPTNDDLRWALAEQQQVVANAMAAVGYQADSGYEQGAPSYLGAGGPQADAGGSADLAAVANAAGQGGQEDGLALGVPTLNYAEISRENSSRGRDRQPLQSAAG